MIQLGDMRIYPIIDGTVYVDPGGAFGLVPLSLYARYLQPDDNHLVPMILLNLLVEVGSKRIVIDTGLGRKLDERARKIWSITRPHGDLIDALARLDFRPEDIDLVIDTHLHADHCGGNTQWDDAGAVIPAFPNAEYVVQRREYEDAMQPNERTAATYLPMNYAPLLDTGQMRLLDGDTELAPGVFGVVTPGHTPGHMSVRMESQGQHAMFVCDLASYAVHFERLGWMTAYDVEPLVTLESKRRWQAWAIEHDALLFFPHDHKRPAGRLKPGAKRPELAPAPLDVV